MSSSVGRGRAVGVVVLLGVTLFVSTLPTWARAFAMLTVGTQEVAVGGSDAAPGVASAGLVVLVAGVVLGLAGRVARVLAGLGVVAGGMLAAVSAALFLADPARAVLPAVAEVSGLTQIDGEIAVTLWPMVALVLAVLATVAGIALPFVAGHWQRVGRRYETGEGAGPQAPRSDSVRGRAIDDWDALSRGDDPSNH